MNAVDEAKANGELVWRKSTYSSGEGGECVEVAVADGAVQTVSSNAVHAIGLTLRTGMPSSVCFESRT